MRRLIQRLKFMRFAVFALPVTAAAGLLSFATVAYAAAEVAPGDGSIVDLARPVYDALMAHQYGLMVTALIVLLVALARRWAPGRLGVFLHSDAGGALAALVAGAATAVGAALAVPGAHLTFGVVKGGVIAGIAAAGGYAVLKHLFVEPVLQKLVPLAPSWLQPLLQVVLSIFDHSTAPPPAEVVAAATAAGAAAVATSPARGSVGVVGIPTQVK